MRLIDADALKEDAELTLMQQECSVCRFNEFMEIIDEQPTIDIIFCKECKHRRGGNCFKEYPPGFNHKKDTEFCSKGERRTK